MKLRQVIFSYYRKRYERENQYHTCEPYFYRMIGVDNESNYCDSLKTLEAMMKDHRNITVFFEGNIPINVDFSLIENIKKELHQMDVSHLSKQAITIFDEIEKNQKFLSALERIVLLALEQESFFSEYTRNDFIAKLIVWSYTYLTPLDFDEHYLPKCIYYGNISPHEIYFLMLAYQMGVDVLYLNPLKETEFERLDGLKLSHQCSEMGVLPIETFVHYANKGHIITQIDSTTKMIQEQIHDVFFEGTDLFKPWQFRKGTTQVLTLNTILEDIFIYWNEHARMRQGFKVVGSTVYVPSFFMKIDGIYQDRLKYKRLLEYCTLSENTLFFKNGSFAPDTVIENEMYQLMFCQLSDGTFLLDEVKKLSFYRLGKYRDELQLFMIEKFNDFICSKRIRTKEQTNEEILRLFYLVLMMEEKVIHAIDNFDYPAAIPKLVLYLSAEEQLSEIMAYLVAYLHTIGFDVIIFNPSGLFNLAQYLQPDLFIEKRLDKMEHQLSYDQVMRVKPGFFSMFAR